MSNLIYKDAICEFYVRVESFGLSLHVRYSRTPCKMIIRHTEKIFDELCISLLDKGFKSLYTTVEDYVQYRYAQHFGFEDQELIVEDDNGIEYQVMKVDL